MALHTNKKTKTTFGITIDQVYWRWVGLALDVSQASATVNVFGYIDAAAFAAGATPIAERKYNVSGAEFMKFANLVDGATPVGLSNAIYDHLIKADEFFANAVKD